MGILPSKNFTKVMLLFTFFLSVLSSFFSNAFNPYTTYLSYLLYLVFSVVVFLYTKKIRVDLLGKILILFSSICLISFIFGVDFETSLSETRKVIINTIVILAFSTLIKERIYLETFIKFVCFSGFILSFFIVIYSFSFGMSGRSYFLGGPNAVGVILSIAGIASIFCYQTKRITFKVTVISLVFILLGIASTLSVRSISIIFLYIIICLIIKWLNSLIRMSFLHVIPKFKFKILAFICLGLLAIYIAMSFEAFERYYDIIIYKFTDSESTSNKLRYYLYTKGVDFFYFAPWIGSGLDSSRYFFLQETGVSTYTHVNFLELAIGTGIIGTFVYYALIIYMSLKLFFSALSRRSSIYNFGFFVSLQSLGGVMSIYSHLLLLLISFWIFYENSER